MRTLQKKNCRRNASYITKQEVERLVQAYLGDGYQSIHGRVFILDAKETGIRERKHLQDRVQEDCWVVYVPNRGGAQSVLSPSRIIVIRKRTGAVVFDGSEGMNWAT